LHENKDILKNNIQQGKITTIAQNQVNAKMSFF